MPALIAARGPPHDVRVLPAFVDAIVGDSGRVCVVGSFRAATLRTAAGRSVHDGSLGFGLGVELALDDRRGFGLRGRLGLCVGFCGGLGLGFAHGQFSNGE